MNEPHLTFTMIQSFDRLPRMHLIKAIQLLGKSKTDEFFILTQYEIKQVSRKGELKYENVYNVIEEYLEGTLPQLVDLEHEKRKEVMT